MNSEEKDRLINEEQNQERVEPGYIKLTKAAELSPYSQEYLSLLARKGKIHARKFGRNWYTTLEDLREYINSQGLPVFIPKAFYTPSYKGKITKPIIVTFEKPPEEIKEEIKIPKEFKKIPLLSVFKILLLIFLILILGSISYYAWQSKTYLIFKERGEWVLGSSKEFLQKSYKGLKEFFVKKPLEEKVVKVLPQEIFLFEREFSGLEENIIGDVKGRFGGFREEFGLSKPEVEKEEQGVVIVPKDLKEIDKFKKELETAFSDKVKVEPDETGKAGIIKPVFAAPPTEEESYLYMMVPVKEE